MMFLEPKLEVLLRTFVLDAKYLNALREVMWSPPAVRWYMEQVASGGLEAYSVEDGLILLECVDWPKGRELSIHGMAGRGIIAPRKAAPIIRDLKQIAAYKGCSMIGGEGIPKGWQRAAVRLGFLPVSTHYVMELEDGKA